MKRPVLVDTSAFFALQNSGDQEEHRQALDAIEILDHQKAYLVTTDYIIDETITLLRSHLSHKTAVLFGRELEKDEIEIIEINSEIRKEAWGIFERYSDKDFSFTDCTSFAVMKRAKIEIAFTLDRHFQQFGFQTLPSVGLRKGK